MRTRFLLESDPPILCTASSLRFTGEESEFIVDVPLVSVMESGCRSAQCRNGSGSLSKKKDEGYSISIKKVAWLLI